MTSKTNPSSGIEAGHAAEKIPVIDDRPALTAWLADEGNAGRSVRTRLKASDRVIARVTDGIYRQPASALRELISNAWDADANNVTILTDAPRFSQMYVRDDGVGMTYETLARLLHSIGGSAKRQREGQELGITSPTDPERTTGGRLIIGKIGIGLFSVSQLARRFQIVTKVRGQNYRLVATVRVRAYSEDGTEDVHREDSDQYINGDVVIRREHTDDLNGHGTDVILQEMKPRVREMLRSADRWSALDEKARAEREEDIETAISIQVEEPKYHAGWLEHLPKSSDEPAVLARPPKLPWTSDVAAGERMSLLMDAVESEFSRTERPDLAKTLDTYLQMLWTLALSAPVGYVDKHPFDLTADSNVNLFWISNETRGQAAELQLKQGQTVRDAVREQVPGHPELEEGQPTAAGDFRVNIDGVELKRPIRFRFIRADTSRGFDKPMLLVGRFVPNLETVDPVLRGGHFGLEGYLFWNGRIVPKENNGVLIRIRGTSGASFDETFFKYQVSELTRLRQISSELFITKGLDAALNIDRESFNFSHPHVQFVGLWLHKAIRQLTNKHKELGKQLRMQHREVTANVARGQIEQHSESIWVARRPSDPLPDVTILADRTQAEAARANGYVALVRADLPTLATFATEADRLDREAKAQALARVLGAFNVFEDMPYDEQQALIEAILKIFISH